MQSQRHLSDESLRGGDVGPVHRHPPGLRRTGVRRVANCAAQCSGDGVPFGDGGESGGVRGHCRGQRRFELADIKGWRVVEPLDEPTAITTLASPSPANQILNFVADPPFDVTKMRIPPCWMST